MSGGGVRSCARVCDGTLYVLAAVSGTCVAGDAATGAGAATAAATRGPLPEVVALAGGAVIAGCVMPAMFSGSDVGGGDGGVVGSGGGDGGLPAVPRRVRRCTEQKLTPTS